MRRRKPSWSRVHFVGIAGYGMSAIAQVLARSGFTVTGCDLNPSVAMEKLSRSNIKVYEGHSANHISEVDLVVVSSAISSENEEIRRAHEMNIPVWHRAEMLGWLMEGMESIAVAGSHGKSSVTAMLGAILEAGGLDPTVIVGADVVEYGTNARFGGGEWVVVEADESDGSFLKLKPKYAVITNIELDHTSHYPNLEALVDAFADFINLIPSDGIIAISADCPNASMLSGAGKAHTITFGINQPADYSIVELHIDEHGASFHLCFRGSVVAGIRLNVCGVFNVQNALAAAAMAHSIGVDPDAISRGLSMFKGIKRRFELVGRMKGKDVIVIDDYAHHPSEVRAAIQSALVLPHKRCLVVFQPHRYTRTLSLHNEFGPAFKGADKVWVTEIFSAWETPIEGVSGKLIYDAICKSLPDVDVYFVEGMDELVDQLTEVAEDGDVLLILGAGDICELPRKLVGTCCSEKRTNEL